MQIKTNNRTILNYRAKATLWLTNSALLLLPPFAINNFIQERYILGWGSVLVVLILLLHLWTIRRGRYLPELTRLGLVPAIILFLALAFKELGITGALWFYPSSIVFYFVLPRVQAITANGILLVIAVPLSLLYLDLGLAARFSITLLAVSSFGGIFLYIIESQQKMVEQKEMQLRDTIASASHELRNPLATMIAQIEAMLDRIRPLDQEQLKILSHSGDHLTELVDDLYLLSLTDVNELNYDKKQEHLDEILNEAIAAISSKFIDKKFNLILSIASPIIIRGDARRLRQIIDNILENCCRYSTSGGDLAITLKPDKKWAVLTITDSGPGVSESELPLLFDRFYRIDKSRSRKYGGTGLGLSLVKALTEVHGGEVNAHHAQKGGLSIMVKLPLIKVDEIKLRINDASR